MAWNTAQHACGHTKQHQLYGKQSSRDYEIKRLEQQDCADCKALKAKEIAAQSDLEGTDKQVAWAHKIRASKAPLMQELLDKLRAMAASTPAAAAEKDVATRYLEGRIACKSAKWWIDNRDYTASNLVREFVLARRKATSTDGILS